MSEVARGAPGYPEGSLHLPPRGWQTKEMREMMEAAGIQPERCETMEDALSMLSKGSAPSAVPGLGRPKACWAERIDKKRKDLEFFYSAGPTRLVPTPHLSLLHLPNKEYMPGPNGTAEPLHEFENKRKWERRAQLAKKRHQRKMKKMGEGGEDGASSMLSGYSAASSAPSYSTPLEPAATPPSPETEPSRGPRIRPQSVVSVKQPLMDRTRPKSAGSTASSVISSTGRSTASIISSTSDQRRVPRGLPQPAVQPYAHHTAQIYRGSYSRRPATPAAKRTAVAFNYPTPLAAAEAALPVRMPSPPQEMIPQGGFHPRRLSTPSDTGAPQLRTRSPAAHGSRPSSRGKMHRSVRDQLNILEISLDEEKMKREKVYADLRETQTQLAAMREVLQRRPGTPSTE